MLLGGGTSCLGVEREHEVERERTSRHPQCEDGVPHDSALDDPQ